MGIPQYNIYWRTSSSPQDEVTRTRFILLSETTKNGQSMLNDEFKTIDNRPSWIVIPERLHSAGSGD